MTSMREDARRAIDARRERAFTTPARIAAPALSTVAMIAVAVVVLAIVGGGAATVLITVGAVALVSAVAAHRTTGSLFAGLTLFLVQPYRPGERVRLYAPEQGAVVEAEVVRIGLLNTTLATSAGLLVVANTRLLRAAPQCRK